VLVPRVFALWGCNRIGLTWQTFLCFRRVSGHTMLYEDSAMLITVEDNYETNFVFKQTAQMWRLCLSGPAFYCIFVYQNSLFAAGCCWRTDCVIQWSVQCVQQLFSLRTNISFLGGNWKDKRRHYISDVAPDCTLPGYWKVTNVILGLDSRVLCVLIIRRTCSYSYVTLVVLE